MTTTWTDKDRRIIPRWRHSTATLDAGESAPLQIGTLPLIPDDQLNAAVKAFEATADLHHASELLGEAILVGDQDQTRKAAEYLLQDQRASTTNKILAETALSDGCFAPSFSALLDDTSLRRAIAANRPLLRVYPSNPLQWVEQARSYLQLGQMRPAMLAMQRALHLAPNLRFVLRAAARFFIHAGLKDRALLLLKDHPRTQRDPWLLAAYLAASQVSEQPPLYTKQALAMLASASFSPFQLSELASAMGGLDLVNGQNRFARRHFRESLRDPTENALAQAVWTQRALQHLEVPLDDASRKGANEAKARQAYIAGSWNQALSACEGWLQDEPFSSRPAVLGSFIAAVALGDYKKAKDLCELGRLANPHHPVLINNLAVALANLGDLQLAQEAFAKIPDSIRNDPEHQVLLATEGLLAFRAGELDRGRHLYNRSIELSQDDRVLQALAFFHLALEESHHDETRASAALAAGEDAYQGLKVAAVESMLGRVRTELQRVRESRKVGTQDAQHLSR